MYLRTVLSITSQLLKIMRTVYSYNHMNSHESHEYSYNHILILMRIHMIHENSYD